MIEDIKDIFYGIYYIGLMLFCLAIVCVPIIAIISWLVGPQQYYNLNTKAWHCVERRTVHSGHYSGKVYIPTTRQVCTTYQEIR